MEKNRFMILIEEGPLKTPLHRKVFESDKKKFYQKSKQSMRIPELFGACINALENDPNWSPKSFKFETTIEPEEKFLHEVYQSDIDRLDELYERSEYKEIPFKYLFRHIVNSLVINNTKSNQGNTK